MYCFYASPRCVGVGLCLANYSSLPMCEGLLLWLHVKEPDFKVLRQCSREIEVECLVKSHTILVRV